LKVRQRQVTVLARNLGAADVDLPAGTLRVVLTQME
jgi:hypothetical protein